MKESFYMGNNVAILDFSSEYFQNVQELVSSNGFKTFIERYFKDLAVNDINMFNWLTNMRSLDEMVKDVVKLTKSLLVLDIDDIFIDEYDQINRMKALYIVENAYNFWRRKQRFSYINVSTNKLSFTSFMELDSKFNQLVLSLYRNCEEKLQGYENKVYRQLQAGTNASFVVKKYRFQLAPKYNFLKNVLFINTVMLRTPIIFHSESNKRVGTFEELDQFPISVANFKAQDWFCYPCFVGKLLCYVYFHRDYCSSGLFLSNLFEMATEQQCVNRKCDLICFFGNPEAVKECGFYYDSENDIYIADIKADWRIEYFGYIKKAILTIHNLMMIKRNHLPIHGSMINVLFKNGKQKSIVFVGDSGAGKSETIETVKKVSNRQISDHSISKIEIIFDDMGCLLEKDGQIVANGTETGAFVRLDDLDKLTAYKDLERNIFINPEKENARVIQPVTSYDLITCDHKVDMVLYANNYQDEVGIRKFDDYKQAIDCFKQGKRMAKNTTQETGLTATYFANPFGPMQKQQQCDPIIERMFKKMIDEGIFVGEIYTNLATEHPENIEQSALALLDSIKKQDF
ncbi:MAG: phosphoenolpyruvate carboxykinase (ATP) [Erysipelotrichaceae bacterium]